MASLNPIYDCCQLCRNIGLVSWILRCHTFSFFHYASSALCIMSYTILSWYCLLPFLCNPYHYIYLCIIMNCYEWLCIIPLSNMRSVISLYTYHNYVSFPFFCRNIRKKDASKFHIQLCISIFCTLLFFLIGIDRTESEVGCTIFSLLIQYFTMASVAWMGAEAVLMFQKLIIVFGHIHTKHIIIISIIAWCKCNNYCSHFVPPPPPPPYNPVLI